MLKITFSDLELSFVSAADTVILTVADGGKLGKIGEGLDKRAGGTISRAIKADGFKGAREKTIAVMAALGVHDSISRIVLVGIGKTESLDSVACQQIGGAAIAAVAGINDEHVVFVADNHDAADSTNDMAANFALGARLRFYRFDKYRTTLKHDQKTSLKSVMMLCANPKDAQDQYKSGQTTADGVFLTRDLVSEPANVLYPAVLAERCLELRKLGVDVKVLDESRLATLGMGALLGVAQGSVHPARVVIMHWQGNGKSSRTTNGKKSQTSRPLAIVGKGVTFDTGGISLKPASGMEKMKYDMAGAAAVIGTMKALVGRKSTANVVGIIGVVENMPSGTAQRPGDVVTAMSGQTIEVINTDAEGRLVLADVLWYAQEQYKPAAIIDLATLTAAITVALGSEYAGLFANDEKLSAQLTAAGQCVGEKLWQLPLHESYDKEIDSAIADVKNMASVNEAGSAMGAHFLKRFIKDGTPWAHLDIAGVAWSNKDKPLCPKGATAFGVRLLDKLVKDCYEK